MVFRENTVFLTHKAGMSFHDIQDEEKVHAKGMSMIYTACVFAGTMLLCFLSGCGLAKREFRLKMEEDLLKKHTAAVAFENDDKFQAVE
eukprot:CAMPEP_0185577880 /NCGR_PEP_ID=MMETSP0434-20130131/11340_1 /TAXON_ID=626734 ORGANISM="Favella taraikaensis, Strain Fe Narragansett Bay" /NCGR_SAMPLE_ID=MMETSP0434 /ASSEMBLY_ACC=CAM_ASM_000379 /LENGTH=88 /DNA_ID=CAMNT_0028195567 /DNA_START=118 /DNA_END=384 /DNA_ORIENTATION=-